MWWKSLNFCVFIPQKPFKYADWWSSNIIIIINMENSCAASYFIYEE